MFNADAFTGLVCLPVSLASVVLACRHSRSDVLMPELMMGYIGGCCLGGSWGLPFCAAKVVGSCRSTSWPFPCPHWQSTYIRLAHSFLPKLIIFAKFSVPKIYSRIMKGMSARTSLRDTSTMVAIAPNFWECGLCLFLSRSDSFR